MGIYGLVNQEMAYPFMKEPMTRVRVMCLLNSIKDNQGTK